MFAGCITMGHGWGISKITKKYFKISNGKLMKLYLNSTKQKCKTAKYKQISERKNSLLIKIC